MKAPQIATSSILGSRPVLSMIVLLVTSTKCITNCRDIMLHNKAPGSFSTATLHKAEIYFKEDRQLPAYSSGGNPFSVDNEKTIVTLIEYAHNLSRANYSIGY